jgi:hypothetical protein
MTYVGVIHAKEKVNAMLSIEHISIVHVEINLMI